MACTNPCVPRRLTLLNGIGSWLGMLGLRLFIAYEFWQSGLVKLHGPNWFADIHMQFPFRSMRFRPKSVGR